jgi:ABC-type multidrug transport system fused ATPase/permease subunit
VAAGTPTITSSPDAVAAPKLTADIEFDHVSFEYERGTTVLDDVSLHLRPGEVVALIGPSGAGKSTLAGLALRLYDPSAGAVLFDGVDIRRYRLDSLVEQVSVVLQEPLLMRATIRENIAYGNPRASTAEIEAAAEGAYCGEFIRHLPQGLDTVIGERGITLSGGSGNALPSPGRLSATRRSSCWTSRRQAWTVAPRTSSCGPWKASWLEGRPS